MPGVMTTWWVSIIAEHRRAKAPKRWGHAPVKARCWTDAASDEAVLEIERRLVPAGEEQDWIVEIRVYLPSTDGSNCGEGLPVARADGGFCRN